jgi:hypothetical protein
MGAQACLGRVVGQHPVDKAWDWERRAPVRSTNGLEWMVLRSEHRL